MTRLKEAIRYNEEDCIALSGDGISDGSRRLVVDQDTGNELIEKIVDGIWQPTSFETGPNSLWVGPNVGLAALGHHMATESANGHLHFHVHSEFADGLSTTDAQMLFAYGYVEGIPIQPDESGEWSGTNLKFDITPQSHTLLDILSIKTGAIAATKYVRLTVRTDNPDTGSIILNQKYPASYFTADTLVDLDLTGNIEFDAGVTFYFEYSSSETFSLKTNAAGDWPWAKISYSSIREDNLLQTSPWIDGGTYTKDESWFIDSRKIYVCNVTGVQTGTFLDNSDKWEPLLSSYEETDPFFSAWDKSSGISIEQYQISNLDTSPWRQDDSTSWQTWTAKSINPGTEKRWRHCDMSSDGKYQVAVGNEGQQVWVSNDYGQTWSARGETLNYMGVACSADGKCMTALVINGIIRISSDYGLTWVLSNSGSQSWCDVVMDATGRLQVASEGGDASNGDLWLSDDYGDTWTAQGLEDPGDTYGYWNDVAMSSDGRYIMATDSAEKKIMRSKDYGATWTYCGPGTGKFWQGVDMSSDGRYVIISSGLSDGNVRISTDYGDSWKTATGCPSGYWHGVAVSGSGKYMVVGSETGSPSEIYMSDDFGENFSAVSGTSGEWADFAMSQDGALRLGASDSDDLFTAQADSVIHGDATIYGDLTSANSPNWDEAYGWGDHSQEGYLTSYTESDPVFTAWDKSSGISIAESQISDLQDYLLTETDPVFLAWDKSEGISITESQISDLKSYLTSESDPIFNAWDKSSGISITMSQISDLAESDPVFSLWDKSSGISIEESQISDLQAYLLSESDPVFSAWDKSTGISITESQISDLAHTPAFDGDISEIFNSAGLFKIQPDAQGDVEVFGDTDVDNADNGKIFKIWRRAPEGNDYIRFYISAGRKAYIHASRELTLQAQNPFVINSVTEDITFKVGDNAGSKKFYFKDSDGNSVVTIDSNGFLSIDANMGGSLNIHRGSNNNINTFMDSAYTDIRFGGAKEYNRIGTWINKPFQIVTNSIDRIIIDQYGRVDIPSSLTVSDLEASDDILAYGDISARNHDVRSAIVFNNKSTQIEAGERHFSQGHTHTAIYNGDWYDASSENISERDIHFSPDGLMMYVIGLASGGTGDCSIWEYSLTIPWDLSTVGTPTIESIETYGSNQVGLFIDIDGRRLWTVCTSNDTVIEYSMSTWNISSLSWVQAKDISGQDSAPSAVFWSANGDRLFIAGDSDNDIVAFSITNEWDISGISWFEDFGTNIDAPTGLHFSSDGRRMYVMDGSAEDDIHEFHLSDPWRIGTARLVNLFDVSAENTSPQGIFIVTDNSKIFMVGTGTPDGVYGYDLGLEVNGLILADGGLTVGGIARMNNLPTSDPVSAGVLWNSSGAVMVSAG